MRLKTKNRWLWSVLLSLALLPLSPAHALSWLRTQDTHLVNEQGTTVTLKGFNLGGWFIQEMWMMPFQTKPPDGSGLAEVKDQVGLWNTIEKRLGAAPTQRVKDALRSAWITEDDFKRLSDAGFNAVRLPFSYDLLQEPNGWSWLDRALDWGKAHHVYVILDMHGAPGRQSGDQCTGEAGRNQLFHDPAMMDATIKLWTTIAQRYANRPEVAAYDLLNEPTGVSEVATLHLAHDHLYRAIRAVDPRHIIIIEDGYKGPTTFPAPAIAGWTNVMFSVHQYRFDAKTGQDQLGGLQTLATAQQQGKARNVPLYLGEFNLEPHGADIAGEYLSAVQENGWSWSWWTYKIANTWTGSLWGWYSSKPGLQLLDPFHDSAEEMLLKIEQVRTPNLVENETLTKAMRVALAAQPPHEIEVTGWRWQTPVATEAAAAAARWAAPGVMTDGPGWNDANFGEDIFDFKPGFAWYRATLPIAVGTRHVLHFEAVDDNATVYLNGQKLAHHEGWNEAFDVPLDAAWHAYSVNEVAVLVENTNQGGGIKGAVTLRVTPLPQ